MKIYTLFRMAGSCLLFLFAVNLQATKNDQTFILNPDDYRHYIDQFNEEDIHGAKTYVYNDKAWGWLRGQIPLLDCPDEAIEKTYYFRWWTLRKHLKKTRETFVMTEFLPNVSWAGPHNTIVCPVGHHLNEFRWYHLTNYLDDYATFWFKEGEVDRYSNWIIYALYERYLVTQDKDMLIALLPKLTEFYERIEQKQLDESGLFWSIDTREGMEFSISGVPDEVVQKSHKHSEVYRAGLALKGYRVATNSYMYANALAISKIAELAGEANIHAKYARKAESLKSLTQEKLWNPEAGFFKSSVTRGDAPELSDAKELSGFIPWYFNIPDATHASAWKYVTDEEVFRSQYGLTTADKSHPHFKYENGHMCFWNGPSWPFATTQTLVALANLLNEYGQNYVSKEDYLDLLSTYASSHRLKLDDGQEISFIGESMDAETGEWISRRIMYERGREDKDRGTYYNHSGYVDLIITGLAGLRPRADNILEVNPLVPHGTWQYFSVDNILYRGHTISIIYDKTGKHYGKGKGLQVFVNGELKASSANIGNLQVELPPAEPYSETSAGWVKYEGNPVLGGDLGTCFDVSLLKEDNYKMWFSWRPERSIALVESSDGKHWNDPRISLGPNESSGWEYQLNRPVVIQKDGEYKMWYTGQINRPVQASEIGLATSSDGKHWQRAQADPVLSPDEPWEKVAVMCPHVIWDEESGIYKMWYSGGEQYEPDAIGYATSTDGINWEKDSRNPIFKANKSNGWEYEKVTACQVVKRGDWYYMFYIGFHDVHWAQIGIARSRDGVTGWERHPENPIIKTSKKGWDRDACYKPYAIFDEENDRWMLWYNGRKLRWEQIGLAIHEGEDLGF